MLNPKLRLGLGSKTPTVFLDLSRAILTGSSKAESLEATTAISYSSSKPSSNKCDAGLTSGPFSSVSSISTVRCSVSEGCARGLRFDLDMKCP